MKHYLTTFPLADLRSGAEIGVDSRSRGRDDGIEELAADVRFNGLLQPLGIWIDPEGNPDIGFVVFGNRRLAALMFNAALFPDVEPERIPCVDLRCSRAELLALSAVENMSRLALHPVDQYEAFAAMRAAGLSIEGIGDRFGLDGKEVEKRLALGNLAPEVREAWVQGTLDREAASAFAAAPDLETQVRVLGELPPMNRTARQVRWLLFGDTSAHAGRLTFVGREAYVEAGGRLQVDLFENVERVLDPALLDRLAADVLEAVAIPKAIEEGWKWAASYDSLTPEQQVARSRWRRVYPGRNPLSDEQVARLDKIEAWLEFGYDDNGRELSDEEMQKLSDEGEAINASVETFGAAIASGAGVIFKIAPDGSLTRLAYIKPEDEPVRESAEPKTPREARAETGETTAVLELARDAQTRGLAIMISEDPTAAKIALVATMLYGKHGMATGSPVCVKVNGKEAGEPLEVPVAANLAETVAHCRSLSPSSLDRLLAQLVGRAIDATSSARQAGAWTKGVTDDGVSAIADLLDPDDLAIEIHKALDLDGYFAGATKGAALEAIKLFDGAEAAARWAKGKKGEIAAEAARLAKPSIWVPASIRPPRHKALARLEKGDAEVTKAEGRASAKEPTESKARGRKAAKPDA